MVDSGVIVLASFVSPFQKDRDRVRGMHDEAGMPFLEVYVRVPLDVAGGTEGALREARAGEIKGFTGIDQPYEEPSFPSWWSTWTLGGRAAGDRQVGRRGSALPGRTGLCALRNGNRDPVDGGGNDDAKNAAARNRGSGTAQP